jgi:SAM-dependent methyltransferase
MRRGRLPYFDLLIDLAASHPQAEVLEPLLWTNHWGYFPEGRRDGAVDADVVAGERLTNEVCTAAGVGGACRLLDVGCEFGGVVRRINADVDNGLLVGLNIDDRQLSFARERIIPQRGNRVAFVHGDGCQLPFGPCSFDVVLAIESLFHLESRRRFFEEACRILRPTGVVGVADLLLADDRVWDIVATGRQSRRALKDFFGVAPGSHVSMRRYERNARAAGMDMATRLDVTEEILPSFSGVRAVFEAIGSEVATEAIGVLESYTRAGLLRYWIMTFCKAGARV